LRRIETNAVFDFGERSRLEEMAWGWHVERFIERPSLSDSGSNGRDGLVELIVDLVFDRATGEH
jgi:hypothetical protein